MARYTSIGALDTGFDTDGIVFAASAKVTTGRAIAIQSDDKIVVAGAKYVTDPNSSNCLDSSGHYCEYLDFWVARYTSTGAPDSTFGTAGEMTTNIDSPGNDDQGRAVSSSRPTARSLSPAILIPASIPSPTMARTNPTAEPTTSPWRATIATERWIQRLAQVAR